ncbi:hypothetical protein BJ508DRAFT_413923 [Ascobolus immersus RN42]|uniref:BTB domain-containing protein n=1 Tax=Ascobolus immersus RN42 TaxID=1160509 RepID=A0A3N4I9K6_ASCIM|nr:hypothetical protein BJ508DRAFT_413923 [Ascobolus immersus RN42]
MTDSPERPSSPLFEDPKEASKWGERTFDILGTKRRVVSAGIPVDTSQGFIDLCEACRRGDLDAVRRAIDNGVNVNAMDEWDYQPLALASLCGHIDIVYLLLESGAICDRDTFQGERAVISALNLQIRNLLLRYRYSKSEDKKQPLAKHLVSMLAGVPFKTFDVTLPAVSASTGVQYEHQLHKFILAARSPFFREHLSKGSQIPVFESDAFAIAVQFLYLCEITDAFKKEGVKDVAKVLQVDRLWNFADSSDDASKRREIEKNEIQVAQDELYKWLEEMVIGRAIRLSPEEADSFEMASENPTFADIILRADETEDDVPEGSEAEAQAVLYPVHRAMLRSKYFTTMLTSGFVESIQPDAHAPLQIVTIDCSPAVLEVVLRFFYTENDDVPLEHALDVLYLCDLLFIKRLPAGCVASIVKYGGGQADLPFEIWDVLRAAWEFKDRKLELFAAKYIAYRLERYIGMKEFREVVMESAAMIRNRQETDTIELIDDIRYHLDRRFNLRMDESGLGTMFVSAFKHANAKKVAEAAAQTAELGASSDQQPSNDTSTKQTDSVAPNGLEESVSNLRITEESKDIPGSEEVVSDKETILTTGEAIKDLKIEDIDPYDVCTIQSIQYEQLMNWIDELLDSLSLEA